jgi:hypothetical protein
VVYDDTGKFYSKRSNLYEEGLEWLLGKWDESREIERDEIYRDLPVERKLQLLSYLAVKKFEQTQYVLFEQTQIERYIAEFLEIGQRDSRAVLRAMEAQHGLLIERAQKVWSFSHLTFQEYLVAKWFHGQTGLTGLVNATTDLYWREVFILMAEMSPNVEQFLRELKIQIDSLSKANSILTNFLTYIERQSLSVQTELKIPFTLPIIRTSYFETGLLYVLLRTGSIPSGLNSGNPIPYFSVLSTTIIGTSIHNRSRFLDQIKNRVSDFVETFDVNACQNAYEDNLRYLIEHLRYRLPSSDDYLKGFLSWSPENGSVWASDLHNVIKYRELFWIDGQQLSEEDKNYLRKYHGLNCFLLDCLNSDSTASNEVRQHIEETLLLPPKHSN